MNNQEAAEMIRDDMKLHHDYLSGTYRKALNMAISALEMQIPKEPNMIQSRYNENLWHRYCPSFKNWIVMWNSRLKHGVMYNNSNSHICPYCGQVIDLEEE